MPISENQTQVAKTMPTKIPIRPAKLVSSTSHQIPGKLTVTELFFEVPLDHANPDKSEKLRIFCRSAVKFEKPAAPKGRKATTRQQDGKGDGGGKDDDGDDDQLPLLVYIQGGPGFGCPPPQDFAIIGEILNRGYKVCDSAFLNLGHLHFGHVKHCAVCGRAMQSGDDRSKSS